MDWDFFFRATQATGTVLLGTGALLIAYLKWKDDREKIRNDLWDIRFEIYQQALYSLNGMKIHGIENWQETSEFKTAMHKSKFAFSDPRPYQLMEEIWNIWYKYRVYYRRVGRPNDAAAVAEIEDLDQRFNRLDVESAFARHLRRKF